MRVYPIEVGEYSDSRVVAVFDEEHIKDAKRIAEMIGGFVCREYGFELNIFKHDEPPSGMRYFVLNMTKAGKTIDGVDTRPLLDGEYGYSVGKLHRCYYEVDKYNKKVPWRQKRSYWRLTVSCYARDEKHAVEIANDIRTRILAGGLPEQGEIGPKQQV